LLLSALAEGRSVLEGALDCEDSRYLADALRQLGVGVTHDEETSQFTVDGAGGAFPVRRGRFFLGNAGTSLRFLTASLAAVGGEFVLDGDRRMRERPIRDLVEALRRLGADIDAPTGCPPVRIGLRPFRGGRVDIPGSVSSQFISALLMAAPLTGETLEIRVTGELVSRPYLELTLACMRQFGVRAFLDDRRSDGQPVLVVPAGSRYRGQPYLVEGDASTASYFLATAAVSGTTVRVEGVGKESLQGDARCADVLAAMGCRVTKEREAMTATGGLLGKVDWDCSEIPDVVPTLAVVALFARGASRLRGVAHLRHKESDRIRSVATEIRKLGGDVIELPDGLQVQGTLGPNPSPLHGATIDSWGDHRVAMAFTVAGLAIPDVVIQKPQVVSKSFPGFFGAMESLGARVAFVGGSLSGS
jgi:3-phosphoshikimate 1-carboxyvinyltransferase